MYIRHPSQRLRHLFEEKPYQGAAPEQADVVFIGLDANYSPNLEQQPELYDRLEQYHRDGVAFWRERRVHHPFLAGGYRGGGLRFHRNFAEIQFRPEEAHRVSFIELVHEPTVESKLKATDLDPRHLARLQQLVSDGRPRRVFLCQQVIRLLRSHESQFGFVPKPIETGDILPLLYREGETTVYQHLHFSCYGKVDHRRREEAKAIRALCSS